MIIEVPLGTIARDAETGEIDIEVTEHGQEIILVPGGRGGLGNDHFKSSTMQSPQFAQPGEDGEATLSLQAKHHKTEESLSKENRWRGPP